MWMTTRSVHREIVLQLFDSVLGIAPLAVELVDVLGRHLQIGHYESHVVLRVTIGVNHDLGLEDDATLMRPGRLRLVERLAVNLLRGSRGPETATCLSHLLARLTLQGLRIAQSDYELDTLTFEKVEHLGCTEATIESDDDPSLRKRGTDLLDNPAGDRYEAVMGTRIAGPKH